MIGWLVNDQLTAIKGTRTFWHHLLDALPGLEAKCCPFPYLADGVEQDAKYEPPDYIIRNAAYFRALNVDCPVVSFVQDILQGAARNQLIEACEHSRVVVFNSEYTRSKYPELHSSRHRVIPIGTDTTLFHPDATFNDKYAAVLWVGSGHQVKNFDLAYKLASESKRRWVFVMKDQTKVDLPNVTTFRSVPQELLADIAALCAVGVCTSAEETQHLAGIEMGLCGVPLVTTNVGIYYNRPAGAWGQVSKGNWHEEIEAAAKLDRKLASAYWLNSGMSLETCTTTWKSVVESLVGAHV